MKPTWLSAWAWCRAIACHLATISLVSVAFNAAAFTYTNFSSTNALSLLGSAAPNGTALRLTAAAEAQSGSMLAIAQQPCAAGFETRFEFRISDPGSRPGTPPGADGLMFAIQNTGPTNSAWHPPGGAQDGAVGVYFNTFLNWPGCTDYTLCDISDNCVGVVSNGLYLAQVNLTPVGMNLKDGAVHAARIAFDGQRMSVWLDGLMILTNVPVPGLGQAVDAGGGAWVGLAASTGWAWENHDVLNWSFSAPTPPSCAPPPSGLVGWWRGENSAADAAGGNNGTIAGTGTVTYGAGVVGQAFVFDGTHRDRIDLGNPTTLRLEDFTLEAWVKRSSPTATSFDILGADGSVCGDGACIIGYGRGGYIFALANDGRMILSRTDIDGLFSTPLVTDTSWHHLAVTKSGSNAVFYVDGVPQATPAYVHPGPYTFDDATCGCSAAVAIGSRGDARGGTFYGMIDEPAVFNRALSAGEIQSIYAAGSTGMCPATPPPVCAPAPAGLVSWWRAESNALDSVGGNNGTPFNGAGFAPGRIGQAFSFNGTNGYVQVPDSPPLRLTNELTIEFWAKRQQADWPTDYLVNKGGDWTRGKLNYGVAIASAPYNFTLRFLFAGGDRGSSSVADLNWHHVAVVARNGDPDPTFYLDGVAQPITARLGAATINLYPSTEPLRIGAQLDPSWNYYSKTLIDELTIYDRALSAAEVLAIYNADGAGKCQEPPSIHAQPASQIVTEHANAAFSVTASGTPQLRYQWRWNGTNISGATNSSLLLSNVPFTAAGSYSVCVTNAFGTALSSDAVLTVNRIPIAQCTDAVVAAGTNCMADASINNGSFDPDGDPIALRQAPPGPYPLGTNRVTLTVTDNHGASNSCSALVVVQDRTPPVIICMPNKQVEAGAAWDFEAPLATDNCGPATVAVLSTVTNALCGCTFAATRTWQAVDGSANRATCNQTVTVVDTTPPRLACPDSEVLEFQDEKGAVARFGITATDLCSAVTVVATPSSGSVFPFGVTTVLVKATDACSNSAQCRFTLTVLGAQGVKSNVLAELTALRAGTNFDRWEGQKLDEAIGHLGSSLTPACWVDQTHLQPKVGNRAMNEEKLAAGALAGLLDAERCPIDAAVLQGFIDRIVRCDRVLAIISIQDAAAAGLNAKKLALGLAEVAKGDDEAAKGHYENAIEHYRSAWRHALRLQLEIGLQADGSVRMHFVGNSSHSYRIEVSTDLLNWVPLGTCAADSEGNVEFTDPNSASLPTCFYRAVEQ
jgi:hypothetical protein